MKTKSDREKPQFLKSLTENFVPKAVLIVGLIVMAYVLILNFRTEFMKLPLFIGLLVVCFLVFLAVLTYRWRQNIKKFLMARYQSKRFLIVLAVLCLLGIFARFAFLGVDYTSATNDPKSFYQNAVSLVETDHLVNDDWYDAHYVAFNPYIYNYIYLLKMAMQVFGTGPLAFIMLNTVIDILAAGVIYLFAKKIKKDHRFALAVAAIWLINPFGIVFSAIPLPVVIVNFFIVLSIFLTYLAVQNIDNIRKFLAINCALAASLALGNLFRPFMIVFVIAIAILYLLLFLKKSPRYIPLLVGSLIILYVPIPIISNLSLRAVESATGYSDLSVDSSWSLLLGSNLKYGGHWNGEDAAIAAKLENEQKLSMREAKKELAKIAIERYLSYTPAELADLMFKKSVDLAGDPADTVHFEMYNYKNPQIQMILTIFASIFVIFVQIASFAYVFYMLKVKKYPLFSIFLLLIFIGLFFSSLLVETMSRYYVPFLTVVIIFLVTKKRFV
ncbi:glycosyltransferase family 39 protein [Candidatus Saccharibacteria bacterium]|nr:glycosyltransferase family 39 protein [Candidatus Saccharibacteria bacterium]MCL1963251.1 glycosyltransferase family 39 protein [Candidatus Saccharibacteria bacterium]